MKDIAEYILDAVYAALYGSILSARHGFEPATEQILHYSRHSASRLRNSNSTFASGVWGCSTLRFRFLLRRKNVETKTNSGTNRHILSIILSR